MRVVYKYGGSSVENTEKIRNIAKHLQKVKDEGNEIVVVASAMGKKTDELMNLAEQVSDKKNSRELDTLLSTGEQQTVALLSMALHSLGVDAVSLTGQQAGFKTSKDHTKGFIEDLDITRVEEHLNKGEIVVVAGFQGINENGDITTLGRGGSDRSAVALAAKLDCECHIFTDVDGIYSIDPRVYSAAKKIDVISYEEMMEMALKGSGVMETSAVELGKKYGVKIYVGESLKEGGGTIIMNKNKSFEERVITGISVDNNVAMVSVKGIDQGVDQTAKIFEIITDYNINVNMINQNYDSNKTLVVSFSCSEDELKIVDDAFKSNEGFVEKFDIDINKELSIISLVGVGMASHFGVASKVFTTLAQNDVEFYQVTTSEISISCAIERTKTKAAVEALARVFEL